MEALLARTALAAERVRRAGEVLVVAHIDADGLTAGSIADLALERAGVEHRVRFVKSLTPDELEKVRDLNPELTLFVDLGSGMADRLDGMEVVICDHHHSGKDLPFHLNPRLFGLDGSTTASGAGMTYLLARALDPANKDLAALGIVGAVGDLQDLHARRLTGINREVLLADARAARVVEPLLDTRLFGRESRPLAKLLQYADDPHLPGLSAREEACLRFLGDLGIPLMQGDRWRRWIDLSAAERRRLLSALASHLLRAGRGAEQARRLVGEVYTLSRETPGQPVHDAKEFATLLNSTARYGKAGVGLAVCRGDRGAAYQDALGLLRDHRMNLVNGLQLVRERGITTLGALQYFDAGDQIRDTVVGIVAGMLYGLEGVRRDLPIVGFARTEDGQTKVSARANRDLVRRGVNLSAALGQAAKVVEGIGGGHDVAAGATIPRGREPEFLAQLELALQAQLATGAKAAA
ncbi:MAG TPA: DHH family phosphoesterase [Candidatus Thermoplasmatota archaeon]|jgi:RecJ-like exonuclease|nr:DHH family phosphoesterase [Candidatus Thermoplasmatota archaeon]